MRHPWAPTLLDGARRKGRSFFKVGSAPQGLGRLLEENRDKVHNNLLASRRLSDSEHEHHRSAMPGASFSITLNLRRDLTLAKARSRSPAGRTGLYVRILASLSTLKAF